MMVSFRSLLDNFIEFDSLHIKTRINDGREDLIHALPKAVRVTQEQKEDILSFWRPYVKTFVEKWAFDLRWFDVYNRTNIFGDELKWYVPDSYFYAVIDTYFNDASKCKSLDDKNLYSLYFHDVNQPKTICRKEAGVFWDEDYRIISKEDVIKRCKDNGMVIIKPSVSACSGAGISKWTSFNNSDEELYRGLNSASSLVVQDYIRQHHCLSQFNDTCVNTMRMVTLLWEGTVHVVTAVAIIGGEGAFTNHLHRGGLIVGLNPDGSMRSKAFDGELNEYEAHPRGPIFANCSIHNYDKCVDLVKTLAPRLVGTSRLAAWDITIDERGEPLLIEVNLMWGGGSSKGCGANVWGAYERHIR